MKRLFALSLTCIALCTAQPVAAQNIDPEEAIVGAWMVDAERFFPLFTEDAGLNTQQARSMGANLLRYTIEVREDGHVVMGGDRSPEPMQIETRDDGTLWMLSPGDAAMSFRAIRFDGPDRFEIPADPAKPEGAAIPFFRVFPEGMLESGEIDPSLESRLEGFWRLDRKSLDTMPWVAAIKNPDMRSAIVGSIKGNQETTLLGFRDGGLYVQPNPDEPPLRATGYTIRAAADDTIAIAIDPMGNEDSEGFLMRIRFENDDRITQLMPPATPAPLPMVRAEDMEFPES